MRLTFSAAVSASYRTLRDEAVTATSGAVRKAHRVNGSSAEWDITVAPSSDAAVTVSISGGTDACGTGDSVCTADGERLSNSPSVTVAGPPTAPGVQPPAAPDDVTAVASRTSRIDVSRTAPAGAVTGYEVEWSSDGNGGWTASDPAHGGTGTQYNDTGLDAGTTRHYRVRAANEAGSGDWSATAAATTELPQLTAELDGMPATHHGATAFTFGLVFSE